MKKIKILYIAVHLGGGVGKAIGGMALSNIDRMESRVILLEEPQNRVYLDRLTDNKIDVQVLTNKDEILAKINNSDVVVFNWWGHPLMIRTMLELPELRCRAIVWSHINGCMYPYLWSGLLTEFDKVLFTSKYSLLNSCWNEADKKDILEKSSIVYGLGDFEPVKVVPKKDYYTAGEMVIGYVGTLNYAKMNSQSMDYYESIINEFRNVKFLMLGNPAEELIEDIETHGLTAYFEFPGYIEDVFPFYRNMDIFVYLLSEKSYATTENSLLEAMAAGLPIIVLNNPVEQHIIVDGVNGLLVNNAEELVERIEWLRQEDNAERLGQQARTFCIENYSGKVNGDIFYKICQNLVNEEKSEHNFKGAMGDTPFKCFLNQAVFDRDLFIKMCDGKAVSKFEIDNVQQIYKESEKASVAQFERYFPKEKEFKLLRKVIKNEN